MLTFTLNKTVSPYHCGDSIGVRVRVECTAENSTTSNGVTTTVESPSMSKIFAYLPKGKFNHVCNVIDMKECPEDTPSSGKWPKWYRLSYVDLLVPHVDMAYDFLEKVEEDVEDLYRMMKRSNEIFGSSTSVIPKVIQEASQENDNGDNVTSG